MPHVVGHRRLPHGYPPDFYPELQRLISCLWRDDSDLCALSSATPPTSPSAVPPAGHQLRTESSMPKPTEKQLADADIVFEHSLYKPKLEPKYPFALVEVDDVPEPDARGLRRVDGFKATWEATIEAGVYILRYRNLYKNQEKI